jgi:hypothetical protein
MSTCPACGHAKSGMGRILLWCFGICIAGFLGLGMIVIVCLVAVAAIGTNAESEFKGVSAQPAVLSVSSNQNYSESH